MKQYQSLFYCAFALLSACAAPVETTAFANMGQDDTHFAFVRQAAPRVYLIPNAPDSAFLSVEQKAMLDHALWEYRQRFNARFRILKPTGARNDNQLAGLVEAMRVYLHRKGVPFNNIAVLPTMSAPGSTALLELQVDGIVGVRPAKCGRWQDDLGDSVDFSHYQDFGCAVKNNLAVQMLRPQEQFDPRRSSQPDAGRIARILGDYRAGKIGASSDLQPANQ